LTFFTGVLKNRADVIKAIDYRPHEWKNHGAILHPPVRVLFSPLIRIYESEQVISPLRLTQNEEKICCEKVRLEPMPRPFTLDFVSNRGGQFVELRLKSSGIKITHAVIMTDLARSTSVDHRRAAPCSYRPWRADKGSVHLGGQVSRDGLSG
jgi:hypothetical protein